MPSVNKDTFSILIWIYFTYFSCFIAMATVPSLRLNRSDVGRPLCLFHDLRGTEFSLLPLSVMLAVGFFAVLCQVEVLFYS